MGLPAMGTLTVFILSAFFMHAAGCVINDYVDCKIDSHVKHTRAHPLPSEAIIKKRSNTAVWPARRDFFRAGVNFK